MKLTKLSVAVAVAAALLAGCSSKKETAPVTAANHYTGVKLSADITDDENKTASEVKVTSKAAHAQALPEAKNAEDVYNININGVTVSTLKVEDKGKQPYLHKGQNSPYVHGIAIDNTKGTKATDGVVFVRSFATLESQVPTEGTANYVGKAVSIAKGQENGATPANLDFTGVADFVNKTFTGSIGTGDTAQAFKSTISKNQIVAAPKTEDDTHVNGVFTGDNASGVAGTHNSKTAYGTFGAEKQNAQPAPAQPAPAQP